MNAICDWGFKYTLYLHNQRQPKKPDLGLSLLHNQVFTFFNTLREDFYECNFDNMYTIEKIHIHISNSNLKVLRCRECTMLMGRGL